MTVVKPAMPDTSVGTWLKISPANESEAHAWTYNGCDASNSAPTCRYVGGASGWRQDLFGSRPRDLWTVGHDATNVDVVGTFQVSSCPAGSPACRPDQRGHGDDNAEVQSYLELDQLKPDGTPCKAIRTNGTALGQELGGDCNIPTLVRHLPITYHIVASISSSCGGSRQFGLSLHFLYKGGNPVKIDGGNLSTVNLFRPPVPASEAAAGRSPWPRSGARTTATGPRCRGYWSMVGR